MSLFKSFNTLLNISIIKSNFSSNFESIIDAFLNCTKTLSNKDDFRFTSGLQFRLLTLLGTEKEG
jgi:hypothetical protein